MRRRAFVAALALSLCTRAERAGAQTGPVFTAEDMLAIRGFAGGQPVAVSSSGRWVAYVLTDRTRYGCAGGSGSAAATISTLPDGSHCGAR